MRPNHDAGQETIDEVSTLQNCHAERNVDTKCGRKKLNFFRRLAEASTLQLPSLFIPHVLQAPPGRGGFLDTTASSPR
jgi:hypothetical protein